MSVTSPDNRISTYNPVVATTEFAAGFPVFDNDDLIVIHDGVERDDFAVTATYVEGISTDAKAVFAVGITGKVLVVGRRDPRRTNRFNNGGPLPIRDQNLALDTLEAESQEARRDLDRALLVPYGATPPSVPGAADIPEGRTLIKGSGSALVVGPSADQISGAEGSATAAAASASAAAASEAAAAASAASMVFKQSETPQTGGGPLTTYDRPAARVVQEIISIYDAIPEAERADIRTGLRSTSCTAFFQKMVNLMNPGGTNIPGGAKIHIPRGKYLIDGAGGIPLQDSIEWIGENKEGTRIQAMGDNPIFKSVGTSADQVGRAAVKNMTLVGAGKTNLHGYGVELIWMNNPLIEDVQFQALRWCIVQEYVVNAFLFGLTSVGSVNTIRGYLWKKAIDSTLYAGYDNTTTISDCYFMAGDVAMVLHGSNGIQMGGNVSMLQGGVKVGAIAETLADGTSFTPGANSDVIHFQHWDGLKLDTVTADRAIRVVKGAMAAPHDFRITSLWAGNVTGANSYVCDFDGVEDFEIIGGNIDVTGQTPFWFNNCKRGKVMGVSVRRYGGNNAQNAALIQNSEAISFLGNSFNIHEAATAGDGVRAESSSRVNVANNDFDFRAITPTGSTARRSILVNTTDSVVSGNPANDRASYPCVESGTSDYNRIFGNPTTVAPTIVGANTTTEGVTGTATYDPASLADGAGVTTTVTVTGAALGDLVEVSFSQPLQGILMTGWVSAANTVSVRFQNESGGIVDLASGTIKARARK